MRQPFTFQQAIADGWSASTLSRAVQRGVVQRVHHGVYVNGSEPPTAEERATATVLSVKGTACGQFAGYLHGLDSARVVPPFAAVPVRLKKHRPYVWAIDLADTETMTVNGLACTSPLRTLTDLARFVDDDRWEQALESALRQRLLTLDQIQQGLFRKRHGNCLIRRVLEQRGECPPTESLLETLAVQLMRRSEMLEVPVRQFEVRNDLGQFQGRVDLAFPEVGLFLELDGQQHLGQPVYDATRQTRIIATTGWLVGRFTWTEIVHNPVSTLRRIEQLYTTACHLNAER